MGRDEFEKWFRERTAGRPFRKLPLPRLLSKRPIFVG
jgi:hypothetical protein